MSPALLPLLVAVPLALAAVGVLVPERVMRAVMVVVPAVTALAGVGLLVVHAERPVIATQVGAFVPGVAIPLVSDTLTALMLTVTGLTAAACLGFAVLSGEARLRFFPSLALMLLAGVNGALMTGDLFNLFVFIEVMLLPSYALIAMTGTWRRLGIGRLFVVVNLLTSTILLAGIGLVYGVAGSVNMGVLVGADAEDPRFVLAVAVVLLALSVKAGVVPLHSWLPRAYPATSGAVMALFSALHTKVAIYAIFRIHQVVLDGAPRWATWVLVLVVATLLVGSFGSLGEKMIRRLLSWQMVAGVGYILLGVAIASRLGLAAGIFYMLHHILVMGSLLLASAAIEHTYRSHRFVRLSGLMKREPLLAVVVALGLLSLTGFPPSSGFWAKVGIVRATNDLGTTAQVVVIAAVVVASIGTLLGLLKLWREVFWGPPLEDLPSGERGPYAVPPETRMPGRHLLPSGLLLVVSLVIFLVPGPLLDLTQRAADGLLDPRAYAAEVTAP